MQIDRWQLPLGLTFKLTQSQMDTYKFTSSKGSFVLGFIRFIDSFFPEYNMFME